jgi:chorismate mutase
VSTTDTTSGLAAELAAPPVEGSVRDRLAEAIYSAEWGARGEREHPWSEIRGIDRDEYLAQADAAYAVVWSELERLTAEIERLRSEYAQAVEDWGRNDEQVLADSQRLAEEVARLRAQLADATRTVDAERVALWLFRAKTARLKPEDAAYARRVWDDIIDQVDQDAWLRYAEAMLADLGLSASAPETAPDTPPRHVVTVTRKLTCWVAQCDTCPQSWSGTQAEAEVWKDQHEADTLVPQLQRPQVCTATHPEFGRCFIDADDHTAPGGQDYHESEEGSWPFEGRPSDSERLAPRSEVDYSIRIKTECCATEGMTGIDCRLPKGHADWHSGRYDCRTDGTESVGYPVCIQWPRNEWDRCEPEQDAAQAARSEATPKGALSAPTILCGHIHDGAECPDPRVPGANGCWAHYGPGTEDWLDEHGTDAPAADAADGSS